MVPYGWGISLSLPFVVPIGRSRLRGNLAFLLRVIRGCENGNLGQLTDQADHSGPETAPNERGMSDFFHLRQESQGEESAEEGREEGMGEYVDD